MRNYNNETVIRVLPVRCMSITVACFTDEKSSVKQHVLYCSSMRNYNNATVIRMLPVRCMRTTVAG